MNKTLIATSLTLAACCAPMLTNAATKPVGFDNCVKAFMQTLPEKIGSSPRLREARYVDQTFGGIAVEDELTMVARNPTTNRALVKATCSFNSSGEVTAMRQESLYSGM
jgi:hypothetical protein